MTFEDYQVAVHDTQDCLRDAGWRIDDAEVVEQGGIPQITYVSVAPKDLVEEQGEDAMDAIYDACRNINSALVEGLYVSTAASEESAEALEARIARAKEEHGPAAVECLADLGVRPPPDAAEDWWVEAAATAMTSASTDCLEVSGYLDAASVDG